MKILFLFFIISSIISFVAYKKKSLSISGCISAIFVGTIILGFGGWSFGIILGTFFVSSSILSHFKEKDKTYLSEKFAKGGQRDISQVLANGGLASILSIIFYYLKHLNFDIEVINSIIVAFIGVMATVNADTWATEIGVLSKSKPRLITTLKEVPTGTSGGITLLGTFATVIGSFLISLVGCTLMAIANIKSAITIFISSFIGGILGSLFDSFIGATIQGIFYCNNCKKETERTIHSCGERTSHIKGVRIIGNDLVNFVSSLFGGAIAVGIYIGICCK